MEDARVFLGSRASKIVRHSPVPVVIAPRGRKEVPGRPSLWGTTPRFLEQFGLRALTDLPRREELVNEPGSPLLAPAPTAPETQSP